MSHTIFKIHILVPTNFCFLLKHLEPKEQITILIRKCLELSKCNHIIVTPLKLIIYNS